MNFQNYQKYAECQLVATLNASYMLGGRVINPDSEEYEKLTELTGAIAGSCISVEKAYKYLGLKYINVKSELESIIFSMNMKLPISISTYSRWYGLHSITIVKIRYNSKRKNYDLKIPNFRKHTDEKMWINWSDFKTMINEKENIIPHRGFFRIFYKEKRSKFYG